MLISTPIRLTLPQQRDLEAAARARDVSPANLARDIVLDVLRTWGAVEYVAGADRKED